MRLRVVPYVATEGGRSYNLKIERFDGLNEVLSQLAVERPIDELFPAGKPDFEVLTDTNAEAFKIFCVVQVEWGRLKEFDWFSATQGVVVLLVSREKTDRTLARIPELPPPDEVWDTASRTYKRPEYAPSPNYKQSFVFGWSLAEGSSDSGLVDATHALACLVRDPKKLAAYEDGIGRHDPLYTISAERPMPVYYACFRNDVLSAAKKYNNNVRDALKVIEALCDSKMEHGGKKLGLYEWTKYLHQESGKSDEYDYELADELRGYYSNVAEYIERTEKSWGFAGRRSEPIRQQINFLPRSPAPPSSRTDTRRGRRDEKWFNSS